MAGTEISKSGKRPFQGWIKFPRNAVAPICGRSGAGAPAPRCSCASSCTALGYRYRLRRKGLPGSPDLVFPARQKVIFVHGCFWHQHNDRKCADARMPKTNLNYWAPKLDRNKQRDKENRDALRAMGWRSLVIWECWTGNKRLERMIQTFLDA